MATRKPTPKPLPKPAPKPNPAPKPAPKPKPQPIPLPTPKPAPLDLVRNPNFDSAMAQQNYQNSLAEQRARIDAERGTPSVDPRAPQDRSDKSKKRSGKEILLSFAGGQYGSINDEAADAIAKKYNLEIFSKPNLNEDNGPIIYGFSVKGDVDKGLSGIKNEPGVRYAQANSRGFIPEYGPDPFVTYEDNRMRAALNGEEPPTAPVGYVEGFDRSKKNLTPPEIGGLGEQGSEEQRMAALIARAQAGQFDEKRSLPAFLSREAMGGGIPSPIPQDQQGDIQKFRNAALAGMGERMPTPIPEGPQVGVGSFGDTARRLEQSGQLPYQQPFNPNTPTLMPIQTSGSGALNQGQQMQDYQNFLKQGMQNSNALNQGAMASFANTQPGMQVPQAGVQIPQPGMQVPQAGIAKPQNPNMAGMVTRQRRQNPAQGKFSTFSNKPARFF